MNILAINGSPRGKGNTSVLLQKILEGAKEAGAETRLICLDEIDLKGCMGCLSCKQNPGFCKREDGLSPVLQDMKSCDGVVVGCPIYMLHVSGQMKIFVDRLYSFYTPREGGGYNSALPAGKKFALVTSQGDKNPDRFHKVVRWIEGMAGVGLGMTSVGKIVHANSKEKPAKDDSVLLEEAHKIGIKLAGGQT